MKFANFQFDQLKKTRLDWSSWSCFAETIKGKKYSKNIIEDKFIELVDSEDYRRAEKEKLVSYLVELSN